MSASPIDRSPAAAAFHSGFVTLLGRPNVGKSTLMNAMVGQKVAIVTHHPQTTRTHLLGILNTPAGQAVFVDTPGVHRGRGHLSREMLRAVRTGLEGRDLALFLADVTRKFGGEDRGALDLLRSVETTPVLLVLNKIDLLKSKAELLPIIAGYRERFAFTDVYPVSALRGDQVAELTASVMAALPPGPEYFGPGQITDQPEAFVISEIIREKAMLLTHEEVPHTLAVRIESDQTVKQNLGPLRRLSAALYCERPGQKAILIGKAGEMIRRIGTQARQELEGKLGTRVFLELQVLVRDGWRDNPRFVADLDFRRE